MDIFAKPRLSSSGGCSASSRERPTSSRGSSSIAGIGYVPGKMDKHFSELVSAGDIYRANTVRQKVPFMPSQGAAVGTSDMEFFAPGTFPNMPTRSMLSCSDHGSASVRSNGSHDIYRAHNERRKNRDHEGQQAVRPQGSCDRNTRREPVSAITQRAAGEWCSLGWQWRVQNPPEITLAECIDVATSLGLPPQTGHCLFEELAAEGGLKGKEGEVISASDLEWFAGHFGPDGLDTNYLMNRPQILPALRRIFGYEGSFECNLEIGAERPMTAASMISPAIAERPSRPQTVAAGVSTAMRKHHPISSKKVDYGDGPRQPPRRPASARPGSSRESARHASKGRSLLSLSAGSEASSSSRRSHGPVMQEMDSSSMASSGFDDAGFDFRPKSASHGLKGSFSPRSLASTAASEDFGYNPLPAQEWGFERLHGPHRSQSRGSTRSGSSCTFSNGTNTFDSSRVAMTLGAIRSGARPPEQTLATGRFVTTPHNMLDEHEEAALAHQRYEADVEIFKHALAQSAGKSTRAIASARRPSSARPAHYVAERMQETIRGKSARSPAVTAYDYANLPVGDVAATGDDSVALSLLMRDF
eukprot:TRINITY_DN52862_c0_g1_i1.p1 TRINITY_DN52862_c0_g1~~TRINITY_DN52862_c0_g1_i1.p1  ORF type:complete len:611 (-),score=98.77 TRINITY_DN52862_c0_g1_i1:94-1854(-)